MTNLDMITTAPHWRVRIVVLVAKALGVTIKLEGFPFGSRRAMTPWQPSGTIGLAQGAALGSSLVRLP